MANLINVITQNLRLKPQNINVPGSPIASDADLANDSVIPIGAHLLDNKGCEFVKVATNIYDLVDRDFVTHDELATNRINQIAYKDEANVFTETNTFKDIKPSGSYNLGASNARWNNIYGNTVNTVKITLNGVDVQKSSGNDDTTSLYLPNIGGDYVHTIAQGNKDGVGGPTKAVYLAANGELKECTNSIDVFKASGANAKEGIVPKPSTTAGTSKFLREDATWSDLPRASKNDLGVVKIGDNINVSNGEISVGKATNNDYGVVKIGDYVNVSNGEISIDKASKNDLGVVKVGDNINVSNGEISVGKATKNDLGVVKIGDYVNVSNGEISVDRASTSDYGVVKVGHALKIGSNGTLDVDEDSFNRIYNAGTGLELSGTTFSLTQDVLNLLNRTYNAGTGLELSGTTFSIDEDYIKNLSVATKYKSQQGMILLSCKIKIQYFMATPNARIAYPYGGYTSNPLALVSRCHLGYDSSPPYDYASDYIGTVNTGKTDCYLSWTQDNADSKYPVIVFGITDGTTTASSSSSSEDDPTYISGTWYYICGDDNPGTSSISASNIWSSYVSDGDYSPRFSGRGSHPASGTYKGTWSWVGFGRNRLYKTTSLYKIA